MAYASRTRLIFRQNFARGNSVALNSPHVALSLLVSLQSAESIKIWSSYGIAGRRCSRRGTHIPVWRSRCLTPGDAAPPRKRSIGLIGTAENRCSVTSRVRPRLIRMSRRWCTAVLTAVSVKALVVERYRLPRGGGNGSDFQSFYEEMVSRKSLCTVTQETAGHCARRLTVLEGYFAVHEDLAIPFGSFDATPFTTRKVVCDFHRRYRQLVEIVNDDVRFGSFAECSTIFETGAQRGLSAQLPVSSFEAHDAAITTFVRNSVG